MGIKMKTIKVNNWSDIPDNYTGKVILSNGDKVWFKNGKCHREDGPAFIYFDGSKYWFKNGKYHREDGPAVISSDGTKEWWINGKRVTAAEVFEQLSAEEKREACFNLDEWE